MLSVFDNPWQKGFFGDDEAERLWAPETQIGHMLAFEAVLAEACEACGLVPDGVGEGAAEAIRRMRIVPESLAEGMARDGLPIVALVAQLRDAAGPCARAVHKGATSQDVLDTALALTLRDLTDLLRQRVEALDACLHALAQAHGTRPLMARTRMQAALEITVRDRVASWSAPLGEHGARLVALRPRVTRLQLGGAVGTGHEWGAKAGALASVMAQRLELSVPEHVWHADRTAISDFAATLSGITGSLGKIGQDVVLMAQQGIDEIALAGGGGSSAMPHKSNPVRAELLVTLARYNATQTSAMFHALVHEQERSGAAWMLEWMVLPQMSMAACRALSAAAELVDQIERIGALDVRPG